MVLAADWVVARKCKVSQTETVTLTLPRVVMDAVRREAPSGGHGRFIADAVSHFIEEQRRQAMRERLIAGYQASADRDQTLTEEWQLLEEEVWEKHIAPVERREWHGGATAENAS
jgi:hypothetical protein